MDPAGYALERISMAELAVQAFAQEYAAARAEVERLKAELREATDLLQQAYNDAQEWQERRDELLKQHKEKP